LWSKLGQTLAKTLVKPLVTPCPSGTFAAFSKFHLNTSNSTNIKVVQFFKGTTFMLYGILNFEWKGVKSLVNCSFHYSSALYKTRTLLGVPAQSIEKIIGQPLQTL
jgi:hypothetical protein